MAVAHRTTMAVALCGLARPHPVLSVQQRRLRSALLGWAGLMTLSIMDDQGCVELLAPATKFQCTTPHSPYFTCISRHHRAPNLQTLLLQGPHNTIAML